MNGLLTTTEMDRARLTHDAAYNGTFWVGVRTMKIFCRPSCPAKQPLERNVVYFRAMAEAVSAGYRPCKRCCRDLQPTRNNGLLTGIVTRTIESPLGDLMLGATERGLCLLEFADRDTLPHEMAVLRKLFRCDLAAGTNRYIEQAGRELGEYFEGDRTSFSISLETPGTPFQTAVWDGLLHIPYGSTVTYAELASRVSRPGAQRAVGRANGENRIAIVVPCHRVVPADRTLRGYGGGVWRKQFLLEHERRHVA